MSLALYENATPFELHCLGPDTAQHSAEWLRRWPLRKFPLLVEGERNVAESSIIIEYLQLAHPGPVRLLPADTMAALDVRFLDRFFDLHVMDAMQVAVDSALKRGPVTCEAGLVLATERLERAYAHACWRARHLRERWKTRGRSVRTSHWGRRTATDAARSGHSRVAAFRRSSPS